MRHETCIKVKGEWMYPYRAVDSAGNTLESLLSENDTQAAKRFLVRALGASHTTTLRVIKVDRNPACPDDPAGGGPIVPKPEPDEPDKAPVPPS
jgi:transposase-like protein